MPFKKYRARLSRRKVRKVRGPKPSMRSFTKRVKRIINAQVERKQYVDYGVNQPMITASATLPSSIQLMPQLAQGTSQESRIGQQIKITKATVKGFINLLPQNASTNPLSTPIWIKIWLVSAKITNSAGWSNASSQSGFFEVGSNTAGFQGNMLDMILPTNKDAFTVYKSKKFNLGATYASTTGPVNHNGYLDNSKMSLPFYFSYGQHYKQQLKYNDDSSALNGNYPYNRNCYLVFQAVYADGSVATGPIAEYHYTINIEYTDM